MRLAVDGLEDALRDADRLLRWADPPADELARFRDGHLAQVDLGGGRRRQHRLVVPEAALVARERAARDDAEHAARGLFADRLEDGPGRLVQPLQRCGE
jgi:hypothetical protein